jgi:poly-beta-1,6-N-acetyl-D-glucosamine synthase
MSIAAWIVVACAALVCWTLFGFPLLLAWRAARLPTVVSRDLSPSDAALPSVTAVIPVHNGAQFLAAKLESVLASHYPADRLDIIVLSDGSTDATAAIAADFQSRGRVYCVTLPKGGKAAALSAAFPMVTSDVVLLTDVRQHLQPECVRRLVAYLEDPAIGVVSGTLRIRSGESSGEASTGLYWKYESWIRDSLSRIDSVLGATGPIYAIRRSLVRPLPPACILDDMWLPMQAVLDGHRAILAPDAVAWDYPTSLTSEFTRKVRTQAGLYQLLALEPRLLNPLRNRLFWSFVNLKLTRLLLLHVLLIALVASAFLPWPWQAVLLSLQGAFYGAVLADRVLPDSSPLTRVTAPIAAFVTLVVAAFCAQAIFFRDPASLWKTTHVREGRQTELAE